MSTLFYALTALPNWIEGWLDRKGEKRKGKIKDTAWLILAVAVFLVILKLLHYDPIPPLVMFATWRVCAFDYIAHGFLKRYSVNHKFINIWEYSGSTTFWWDQLVGKINPLLRGSLRLLLFAAATIYYYKKSGFITPGFL